MPKTLSSPAVRFLLALGVISAASIWGLLYSTPQGLGLSDDSIAYIAGARSLLQGLGYREIWLASSQPVTHLPPGFSTVLALLGWISGLDPLRGVRLLNALLLGANTTGMGLVGWRMTNSRLAGVFLALLFASNASLLRLHADAISEPLYIFLSLLAFWFFAAYVDTLEPARARDAADGILDRQGYSRWLWLVLAGALLGVAYLTRYAGLALLATILVTLILVHSSWRQRLMSTIVFAGSVVPWLLAWGVRNRLLGGSITNRALAWHPVTSENFESAIYNASEFLIPVEAWRRALIRIPGFFEAVLLVLGVGLLIWLAHIIRTRFFTPEAPRPETFSLVNGLYIFGYLASVITAMTLFDASTKFVLRILAPVYTSLLVLLVAGGAWTWRSPSRFWRPVTPLLAILVLGLSSYDTFGTVALLHKGGQGYASFQWYDSEAMTFLRALPADVMIYTNEPGAVYLYTGRGCYTLPSSFDPVTAQSRPGFMEGVARMQADIRSGIAVLALFDKREASPEEIAALTAGLHLAHKSAGDEIYSAAPQ